MNTSAWSRNVLLPATLLACLAASRLAAQPATNAVPDLRTLLSTPQNEMRIVAQRYQSDRSNLSRYYSLQLAPGYYARFKLFYADWLAAVQKLDASRFSEEGKSEHARLIETLQREAKQLEDNARSQTLIVPLLPFAEKIIALDDSRRRMEKVDPVKVAAIVDEVAKLTIQARKTLNDDSNLKARLGGRPAVEAVNTLRTTLKNWNAFYDDYDPMFTW